jgi:hypothetical protein
MLQTPMFRRIVMWFQCAAGLVRAWAIRLGRTMAGVRLPPVRDDRLLSESDIAFILRVAAGLMKFGAARTGRKCFIRSYILATVLRRWGLPVSINVGLRNLNGTGQTEGHCWLTTPEGALFAEPADPLQEYPVFMGDGPPGIRYWVGPTGN